MGQKDQWHVDQKLSSAEWNYSQIKIEAFSLIFGVKKLHNFLYGHTFLLVTDCKPLLTIVGPKKGMPVKATNGL